MRIRFRWKILRSTSRQKILANHTASFFIVMESVALVKFQRDIMEVLQKGLNLIGGFGTLTSPVIIKPNLCTITDNTGYSVTHAVVVERLLDLLFYQNPNLSVNIVESDSQSKWANEAFTRFGYTDVALQFQKLGYEVNLINLSGSPTEKMTFNGDYFRDPELPDILVNPGYVISVAQAKTHYLTSITGGLKNLFGCLPRKNKSYYHPNINEVITDLNRLIRVNLSVVDARMGIVGWNGPETKTLNRFILGHKPVSVDAILGKLMGLEPEEIQHLVQCQKYELGTITPRILKDSGDD
jgi:uncharacterized protein (DUF362 family)